MSIPPSDLKLSEFFDRCARERLMHDFPAEELVKLDLFFGLWKIAPGFRVLEPGCGSGRLTEHLARAVGADGEVYACDVSAGMLDSARERAMPSQVRLVHGSAARIDRPGEWFDRIICLNVFPHFEEKGVVLAEFARVLKPAGELWINHFEGRDRLNDFHREAAPEVADHMLPCRYSLGKLLDGAGFALADYRDDDEAYWVRATRRTD